MNRITLLLLACVVAGGVWLAENWDEVRLAAGIDEPLESRAIRLAKTDSSIARSEHNHVVIQHHMDNHDNVEIIGWQAEKKTERIYLVKFLYKQDDEPGGYYFEVDIDGPNVRTIGFESGLAEKYGVTPRSLW